MRNFYEQIYFAIIISGVLVLWMLMGSWTPAVHGGCEQPVDSRGKMETETPLQEGVAGWVEDPDGRPVPGALINPQSLDDPASAIPEIAVFTDTEGRFGWPLRHGNYLITATADGYQAASIKVTVTPGQVVSVNIILQ